MTADDHVAKILRCGLVGPGRRRNGLGPFLAAFAESAGLRVVAVAGRDSERTRSDADALATELGHPLAAFTSVESMLDRTDLDAMIIASPAQAHAAALHAAAARGLDVLCEKPLCARADAAAVDHLLDTFLASGAVLMENCQWPFVLGDFRRLYPAVREPAERLILGLSPAAGGPMLLEDSLSHFLSLVQALAPAADLGGARWSFDRPIESTTTAATLELEVAQPGARFHGRFELAVVASQPRPAWLVVDGLRADRAIRLPGYRQELVAPDGRWQPLDDPMRQLVYGFRTLVRERHLDQIRAESERIRHRAALYRRILDSCLGPAG
jgi:hypothetical protein